MRIVHSLPGRVRLELPEILHNPVLTRAVKIYLGMVKGIIEAQANSCSGRVLIRYQPHELQLEKLIEIIKRNFLPLAQEMGKKSFRTGKSKAKRALDLRNLHRLSWETAAALEPEINRGNLNLGGSLASAPLANTSASHLSLNCSDLVHRLGTDLDSGLDTYEAKKRLKSLGPNFLPSPMQPSVIDIFIRTLTESYMSKVLLGLGGFSLMMGKTANAMMSIGVLVANTSMAVVQERRTQSSLRLLSDLVPPQAAVLRNGKQLNVNAASLVPGDVILIDAGEKVPADARLVAANQLMVEEASLTGESLPVLKEANAGHRANIVYMGTAVLSGRGKGVVTATGGSTEIGRISRTIVTAPGKTPFHQRLDEVFAILVHGGLAISGASVLAGLWHGKTMGDIIESATGLAVSFIPDGLAPIITLSTALGAMRLLKKQVALRQLPAVDTLGCTTVICCDKTGTLTRNKMEVREVYCLNTQWKLDGGSFVPSEKPFVQTPEETLKRVSSIAFLCNNAILKDSGEDGNTAEGESTECALLIGALKAGFSQAEAGKFERREEIPFSSETMYMAVIVEKDGEHWSMVKGAPDIVLERCTAVEREGRIYPISKDTREEILAKVGHMSGRALRVLAMAYKPWDQDKSRDQELIFAGLVGIIDPPRPEAKILTENCRKAGVKLVMITGDHRETALAIAREIGVVDSEDAQALTGKDLQLMGKEELKQAVGSIRVYARTSPSQKQELIQALKRRGEIVTMVGDGVNDVPAIKEAHLGVAMAASGTAVARETSAVALTKDNIGGLVEAIKEGRNVYTNIRSTMRYMITTNFGDGIVILLASILGQPIPLTPLQLLWLNFTSDPYISWSLANFPPDTKVMEGPPRKANASIFGQGLGRNILSRSLCIGLSAFMVYSNSLKRDSNLNLTRTKTMAALGLGRLLYVTDFRRRNNAKGVNKTLFRGGLLMLSALMSAAYIPGLGTSLETTPLALGDWMPVLGWTSLGYLVDTGVNHVVKT